MKYNNVLNEVNRMDRNLKNAKDVEKWCKMNFEHKELWERRLPTSNSKDKEEKRLGFALSKIRQRVSNIYEGDKLEKIGNLEDRETVEIVRRLDDEYGYGESQKHYKLGKALEIKNWCEKKFEGKEIWERRLPSIISKDEDEKNKGIALSSIRDKTLKRYDGKRIEEIENEDDRKVAEIVKKLDEEYGFGETQKHHKLGQVLKIEDWCKKNFDGKEIWEKRLPSKRSKDEKENKMGVALSTIRDRVLKQYEGKELEDIEDKDDRKIAEIVRRLDEEYGIRIALKNVLEIENWCKTNFEGKEIKERRLPTQISKDENEKRMGIALATVRQKVLKQYEGKELDEIENEEDRKIAEIVKRLDEEYNLKKSKEIALKDAKQERDSAKQKNKETQELEERVEKELEEKYKNNER